MLTENQFYISRTAVIVVTNARGSHSVSKVKLTPQEFENNAHKV